MIRPNNNILLNTNIPQSVGNGFYVPLNIASCVFGCPKRFGLPKTNLDFLQSRKSL